MTDADFPQKPVLNGHGHHHTRIPYSNGHRCVVTIADDRPHHVTYSTTTTVTTCGLYRNGAPVMHNGHQVKWTPVGLPHYHENHGGNSGRLTIVFTASDPTFVAQR